MVQIARLNGDIRQLFSEDDHQRVARAAAECRTHVNDRREREDELPDHGTDNTCSHAARGR